MRTLEDYKKKYMHPPYTDSPFEDVNKSEIFSLLEELFSGMEDAANKEKEHNEMLRKSLKKSRDDIKASEELLKSLGYGTDGRPITGTL